MARQLPPHLSDVLYKLSKKGKLFIDCYEGHEKEMQAIASKLAEISEQVKEMQKDTDMARTFGAVFGGLGIVMGVAAAFLAGVSSAGERAAKVAMVGGTAVLYGGASVIGANVTKALTEKTSIETVEMLAKELMTIVKVQKDVLKDIKEVSEELEEKSSSLMTKTRAQAKSGLSEMKKLQELLRQAAELAERSREVMNATLATQRGVGELFNLISKFTQITSTPEVDAELINCIKGSALQCKKTLRESVKLRNMLKDFEDLQIE